MLLIKNTTSVRMEPLCIPANPNAGFPKPCTVRTTTIGGVRMVSAIDVVKLVVPVNAHMYWSRTVSAYPDLMLGFTSYKFHGKGQRKTPVIDACGV